MVQYMILTTHYSEILKKSIQEAEKYSFDLKDKWQETLTGEIYRFKFECDSKDEEALLETLATIVSNIIQSNILTSFAKQCLKQKENLTCKEKKEIEELFVLNNYVAKEDGVSYISYHLLYTPVLKSLNRYKHINIDGWGIFRTHQYKVILEDLLEQTIYDYQTQKDYLRVISLLRETRKAQEALEATLHLIPEVNKKMKILNTNKEDITKEYIERYSSDLIKEPDVTYEDLIMNIFMTVCPNKVVIHNKTRYNNTHFIETLEMVFEGQIEYCDGCENCLYQENLSSE